MATMLPFCVLPRGTEVLTCDQFIEGVHFLGDQHPPEASGFKALARGGQRRRSHGRAAAIFPAESWPCPRRAPADGFDRMVTGMAKAVRQLGLTLAGGDTAQAPSPDGGTALSLTVGGEIQAGRAVQRRGARPDDAVFVTGRAGGSATGARTGAAGLASPAPLAAIAEATLLPYDSGPTWEMASPGRRLASAMMDLSDGLSTDLSRLWPRERGRRPFVHGADSSCDCPQTAARRMRRSDAGPSWRRGLRSAVHRAGAPRFQDSAENFRHEDYSDWQYC